MCFVMIIKFKMSFGWFGVFQWTEGVHLTSRSEKLHTVLIFYPCNEMKGSMFGHQMFLICRGDRTHYLNLNLNLNSLLVKRQIDNPSPGAVTGGN